jgi:intracellular septation protein
MKLLIDIIPIALFFIAFKFYDIYVATIVAMAASIVQTFWHRFSTGKFETMHLITLIIILLLGGMTLFFQDERFIKWKPTIVNWAFALALIIGTFFLKKPAIQALLGSKITLPLTVWINLNWGWFIFFILSGALNLYVAYNYSTDAWVNFKLFGMMGITLIFVILQGIYISKYIQEPPSN